MTNTAKFDAAVAKYSPRFQQELGLKGFQVDGIFGNLGHESGGLTIFHEQGQAADKGGIGWEQATGPRRRQYEAWCANAKLAQDSDEANVSFIIHELHTTEAAALDALKRTRTRDDATRVYMQDDERPGVPALASRIQWAIRAEAARVKAESISKPMTDTVTNNDAVLAALESLFAKLEDLAANAAVKAGAPAAIVSVVRLVLNQFDLPKLALAGLGKLTAPQAA